MGHGEQRAHRSAVLPASDDRGCRHAGMRAAGALLNPTGLRGAAVELAWVSAHVAMYPLGALGEKARSEVDHLRVEHLDPVRRGLLIGDVEAAGTPILLVHGMVDNRSIFTLLRRGLHRRGFGRVVTMNYSPLTSDVRGAARRLAAHVERLCADTGYERVHIVGHSMGGLAARYYVQHLGGDARVHTVVTMGTPHGGTVMARVLPHPLLRQLRPGSDVLDELAAPAPGCRTRMVAFWSDLDQMVVPQRNARIVHADLHARNVFVRGVGHMSLPINGRVVHEICATLAHLDSDGSQLTAGVTPIGAERPERGSAWHAPAGRRSGAETTRRYP